MAGTPPATDPVATRPRQRRRRGTGVPIQRYVVGLIALFLVAALVGTVYGWTRTRDDARRSAGDDTSFAARLAAAAVTRAVQDLQSAVAQTAAVPGIEKALAGAPCQLNVSDATAITKSHLDVIGADGTVGCTSLPDRSARYDVQRWLAQGQPFLLDQITDPVTGHLALVGVAQIGTSGVGVVAGFADLTTLATGLADEFGGPRHLELLVATADGATAISRSLGGGRWTGAALAGTPFAAASGGTRPDVDGTRRIYGQASVDALRWTVYAGADESAALAAASRSFRRELAIILGGLGLTLVAAAFGQRAIVRPLRQLSRGVRAATGGERAPLEPVHGAREVLTLREDFDRLITAVDRELAERERAEAEARTSEENYRTLFDGHPHPMWVYDGQTRVLLAVNDAAVAHYGYSRDEFLAMRADDRQIAPAPDPDAPAATPERARHITRAGSAIDVAVTTHAIRFGGRDARLVLAEDVTERDRLERQTRQTQRLESLGQLAGGVAHDFNNLLTIVLNYAHFVEGTAAEAVGGADPDERWVLVREDVDRILQAVDSGSHLTHQLLAFARREVVQPRVLDLGAVVRDVARLLERSLGRPIDLRVTVAPDAWRVRVDPGQIEQLLVNLAVNARDAMPHGGTLAIAADNIEADEDYALYHDGVAPGRYLRVRVSDSGVGMSRETVERAFEPFFTTKPAGQGTGLGLATVYGIVRQAGGAVHIYSEPGLGTTISVLLPATVDPEDVPHPAVPDAVGGGAETILVVEDREELRSAIERILRRQGYAVLSAASSEEAVGVSRAHDGPIHLLLTDVVLRGPGGGRATAAAIGADRPAMPVLYMSGHAESVLVADGSVDPDAALLQKPFSADTLLARVRELVRHDYVD